VRRTAAAGLAREAPLGHDVARQKRMPSKGPAAQLDAELAEERRAARHHASPHALSSALRCAGLSTTARRPACAAKIASRGHRTRARDREVGALHQRPRAAQRHEASALAERGAVVGVARERALLAPIRTASRIALAIVNRAR
jgi:hypothetical protein